MNAIDFISVLYCALMLAIKVPLAILAYFISFYSKEKDHVQQSLFQRIVVTSIKSFQLYLPLWLLRNLFSIFTGLYHSQENRKNWVKKLNATNEQDGWEGYLIAKNIERSEIGDDDVHMVVLYAHGGGFVCGDALGPLEMFVDWIKEWELSHGKKTQILSLEYKLSPEHAFPTARDNMLECYKWLVNEKKINPSKIAFAGDSAGGNLAVTSAVYLINQLCIDPPGSLILLSPALSGVGDAKSFKKNALYDILDTSWFHYCVKEYIGDSNLLPTCPMISPLYEDQIATGFPKVWACVGGYEVFLDDVISFIDKLMAKRIKAELVIEDSNFHNYSIANILSRDGAYENSIKRIGKFLYV